MRPFLWISLLFITFYFVYGAYMPFWSLWLASRGITADQIGLLLGLGLALRFVGNLSIMSRAKQASMLIPICRYLAIASLIGFAGFYLCGSFWPIFALMVMINFIYPTMMPLSDSIAARMMLQIKMDYGKVRLWGSAAFIVASTLVGLLVQHFGADWVLHSIMLGLFLLCGLVFFVPMSPAPQDANVQGSRASFSSLLKSKPFMLFLLVTSLLQGSHAAYYGFSALYWKSHGYAENLIGYLWGLGVMAEILMFAASRRLLARFSYQQLFYVGAIGCLIRWSMLASTTELVWLAVAQLLHSVTFCVSHLAALRYMTQQLPAQQVIPAQTLYAALPTGMVTALLTAGVGFGFTQWQGGVFWGMAVLALPVFLIKVPHITAPVASKA